MITKKIILHENNFINMIVELSEKAQINADFSKAVLLEFFTYGDCLTLDEFLYMLEIDNKKNSFNINLDALSEI